MKANSGSPALSLILCSRNDQYMGNSRWRLQTALNYVAGKVHELGRENDVEILVADWGSEVPLREVIPLGPAACRLVRFLLIPPDTARQLQRDSPFPEVLALNAAARRASGRYIGRIDQDTLVGRRFLEAFFDLHEGRRRLEVPMPGALLFANKRMVPYRLSARCPQLGAVDRYIRGFGRHLPIDRKPRKPFYEYAVGIWLAHRDLWHESGGYRESMIYMNSMEIEMIGRLMEEHAIVDLGKLVDYDFYHLEHYHPLEPRRASRFRKVNPDPPYIRTDSLNPNGAHWGLAQYPLRAQTHGRNIDGAPTTESPLELPKYLCLICFVGVQFALDWLILRMRGVVRESKAFIAFGRHCRSIAWQTVYDEPFAAWPQLLVARWKRRKRRP